MALESLANRVILIGKGEIVFDGTINYLKQKYGNAKTIEIETNEKNSKINLKGIISQDKSINGYNFTIDTSLLSISSFLNYLSKSYNINDIEIDNEPLDNIALKLYKDYKL